jgi:hypothetical protein
MTQANEHFVEPVRSFLQNVIAQPQHHARFLNMLSMLEHMGSRKIMLSQMHQTLTEDSLKHLAEEARHAYFFKRQAERIAGHAMNGYTDENTHARRPAHMYFQRLDAGIARHVAAHDAYPWVSMIVELRACWLYHLYQGVLVESKQTLSLKSLLAEEDMHLAEMFAMVGDDTTRLQELSALETRLFGRLWPQIDQFAPLEHAA